MKPPPQGRFLALDGLRGVAAVSVLIFHLFWNSAGSAELLALMPDFVVIATGALRSGVAIFFVISGFVIAYTTSGMRTLRSGARFAVRRQVRLDPPYYSALALVLIIEIVQRVIPGLTGRVFSPLDVVLNMLYLQDIFGVPSILSVAWTLCLEVQFYLVVVVLTLGAGAIAGEDRRRDRVLMASTAGLAAVSMSLPLLGLSSGPWVIGVWWMFGIGMALAWFARGMLAGRCMIVIFAVLTAWVVSLMMLDRADPWGGEWFAVATGAFIALLLARRRLARSPGRPLLHLGRLSYSLYLVHLPVIALVTGGALKFFGGSAWVQVSAVALAGVASIVVAEILHRAVEVPAIVWSKRLRREPASPSGGSIA